MGCIMKDSGPLGHIHRIPDKEEDIKTQFLLFKGSSSDNNSRIKPNTGRSTSFLLDYKNTSSLRQFPKNVMKLAIIIHGFGENPTRRDLMDMKDSLIRSAKVAAVIMIDWREGASLPYIRCFKYPISWKTNSSSC
jgi:hypothetical protein